MGSTAAQKPRSKFSVIPLVVDHYSTFKSYGQNRVVITDYLVYVGLPVLVAITTYSLRLKANNVPDILAAITILTGLIFNAVLLVSDLSARASEVNKGSLSQEAIVQLAREVRANISYAVLLGLALSALLGGIAMFTDTNKPLNPWLTMIVIALGVQLLLTVLLILKRIRALFVGFEQKEDRVP